MNTLNFVKDQLRQTWESLISGAIDAMPMVVAGLVLLVIALIVAKVLQKVTRSVLQRLGLDELAKRSGITASLEGVGIKQPLSQILPTLLYYLLLFLFLRTAADSMGLEPISQAIGTFLSFIPNLVAASLVLLAGSLLSQFGGNAVGTAAESAGLDFGKGLGKLVSALILLVAVLMAVGQLGIDTDIVRIISGALMFGLALGFALMFGLGSRKLAENLLTGFYLRKTLELGKPISVLGQEGTLTEVAPSLTRIRRTDGHTVTIANSIVHDGVVEQG